MRNFEMRKFSREVGAYTIPRGQQPILQAISTIANHGVTGNYGTHLKTCLWDKDRSRQIDAIRFYSLNQNATRGRVEESTWKGDVDNYSMKELLVLIYEVGRIELNMNVDFEWVRFLFTKQLIPFLETWSTMAFTAAPVLGEFWMDNDQEYFDLVTKKLRSAQCTLAAAHKRFMFQFQKKFPLPGEQMI